MTKQELLEILARRGLVVEYRAGCVTLYKEDFLPEELDATRKSMSGLIQKAYWRAIRRNDAAQRGYSDGA